MHIEKVGGSTLLRVLKDEFGVSWNGGPHNLLTLSAATVLKKSKFAVGHVHLAHLVRHNKQNKPILAFLRKPLDRCISHIRYYKSVAQRRDKYSRIYFMRNLNLNRLEHIQEIVARIPDVVNEFDYLSPPGIDLRFEMMSDDKVDEVAHYASKNIAFLGDIKDFSGSLHKLNAALNLNINVARASQQHVNKTPDKIEKITNPEVLTFLKDRVKWSEKLYAKLTAAQRWRIAVPKNPKKRHSPFVQYVLPEGFDPDRYISLHPDLKSTAKIRFLKPISMHQRNYQHHKSSRKRAEIQENIQQKRYEMRKWAMLHYVTEGQKQRRAFK